MMEELANEKRQKILNGEMKNVADQEKDLLTMMIEADIEEGTETTATQLRVHILVLQLLFLFDNSKNHRKTLLYSLWLVMILLPTLCPYVCTVLEKIFMYNKNYERNS